MSPYKTPCGTILEHFLRQNTLYESAVNGHLYFFPTPLFSCFFSPWQIQNRPWRIRFAEPDSAGSAQIRETNRFYLASIVKCTHSRSEFWRKSSIFVLLLYNKGVSPVAGKRRFAVGG